MWGDAYITNQNVQGIKESIMAMRNPLDSWYKSDSYYPRFTLERLSLPEVTELFILGDRDRELSQKLSKAGTEHRKHLRFIRVWADFCFPRYMWSEIDTYKHIDKLSCSTMHTIAKNDLAIFDFVNNSISTEELSVLNSLISTYQKNKDMNAFLELKARLPEGFLQLRSISTNYEALLAMYCQRKNHRLPEWKIICDWILELPYFKQLTGVGIE